MLRYGIMSCSSIAPRFIAAVREAQAGEIVALSSRSLEKAREKAALWGVPKAYGSDEALLSDPSVNIVYISTVNALHYRSAKAALLAGKHVICEKPCTTTRKDTSELYALAEEKGLFFMEAQKMLFLPAMQAVKESLEKGSLGKPCMVEMSQSFSAQYNDWQFDPKAGGGTLLSAGIYAAHFLLWLFGEVESCRLESSVMGNGAEWQYVISGRTKSDVLFTATNSTKTVLDNRAVIYCEKGKIVIPNFWKARAAYFHTENGTEAAEYPCEHELCYEAKHIQDCIARGYRTSPVITPALSLEGITLLESLKKGNDR